ncbi:MAG: hypothetical protein U0798_04830 [Gemmataceae bacterium]
MRFARPNILPFSSPHRSHDRGTGDVAFSSLPLLRRLTQALIDSHRFLLACQKRNERATGKQRRWGVPNLFFFHRDIQKEWEAKQADKQPITSQFAAPVARRDPEAAAAWTILPDLLADVLILLYGSRMVRRAARAIPGLRQAAEKLAPTISECRDLVEILAMPEDETILCLHPRAGVGVRVRMRGIATVQEFHVLFADAVGVTLPGSRPAPQVVQAYRAGSPMIGGEPLIATARFQLFKPEALQADGTLPSGFQASEHWLWGPERLAEIPFVSGERVLLLDEPVFAMKWEASRLLPIPPDRVEIVEFLDDAGVREWMSQYLGHPVGVKPMTVRRAA